MDEVGITGGLAGRLADVRAGIERACSRTGRDPAAVTLVAVSKNVPPEVIREAYACGITLFGESRVQEAQAKMALCPGRITWHLVGHLQRNKAAQAAALFDMIHSVDSLRLLEALERGSQAAGRRIRACLEVNVAGESTKFGLAPHEVPAVLRAAVSCEWVTIDGLMTVPPFAEDPEKTRSYFRQLREWRDAWQEETGFALAALSMGMSHDYETAVEEGATLVRVGTALFGARGPA